MIQENNTYVMVTEVTALPFMPVPAENVDIFGQGSFLRWIPI